MGSMLGSQGGGYPAFQGNTGSPGAGYGAYVQQQQDAMRRAFMNQAASTGMAGSGQTQASMSQQFAPVPPQQGGGSKYAPQGGTGVSGYGGGSPKGGSQGVGMNLGPGFQMSQGAPSAPTNPAVAQYQKLQGMPVGADRSAFMSQILGSDSGAGFHQQMKNAGWSLGAQNPQGEYTYNPPPAFAQNGPTGPSQFGGALGQNFQSAFPGVISPSAGFGMPFGSFGYGASPMFGSYGSYGGYPYGK